ncbi:MAG: hypothetical protein JOS17DRAFT_769575 [Linnemannia elongata]|nr:MAG: hypothetical protein JOS17DRAFT_769575 [Linnemannia elongata]
MLKQEQKLHDETCQFLPVVQCDNFLQAKLSQNESGFDRPVRTDSNDPQRSIPQPKNNASDGVVLTSHDSEGLQVSGVGKPMNTTKKCGGVLFLICTVQAMRSVDVSLPLNAAPPATPDEIFHVDIQLDPDTQKDIVLWDDILQAFRNVVQVRNKTRVVRFLKGKDLRM